MEMGLMPGQPAGAAFAPGPYMNNPMGLPYQKCMDNDMCTSWVAMRSLMPTSVNGTTASFSTGSFSPGSYFPQPAPSTPAQTEGTGGAAGAQANVMPRMPGMLPVGFHPELYGLDPDAQMKDCADEASCMAGLRAFSAMNGQPMPMFIPTVMLASPRPQYYPRQQYYNPRQQYYNPQYTLRAPRPHYNLRSAYGVPHYYGYQPVYYQPSFYYY